MNSLALLSKSNFTNYMKINFKIILLFCVNTLIKTCIHMCIVNKIPCANHTLFINQNAYFYIKYGDEKKRQTNCWLIALFIISATELIDILDSRIFLFIILHSIVQLIFRSKITVIPSIWFFSCENVIDLKGNKKRTNL